MRGMDIKVEQGLQTFGSLRSPKVRVFTRIDSGHHQYKQDCGLRAIKGVGNGFEGSRTEHLIVEGHTSRLCRDNQFPC